MTSLNIKRLTETARIPKRQTPGSAGYDLCADLSEAVTIEPGQTFMVHTGIAIAIDTPYAAAFIYARSGIASRYTVAPANCVGVIDSDYRGEVCVPLHNGGSAPFTVNPGDRIAQLVFAPVFLPDLIECDTLDETQRGEGGFGSTAV